METANRLIHESSPYLLQHAHNPVEWYPWGPEAFERARRENKPVLLSIGYSACHWCHVMERESFEDRQTAEMMNRLFVNIKVDREERPDVDSIYMNYVQMTTGSGGWPLTVFLTPEQVPFFGGTYFPPEPAHGRPSFRQLLEAVAEAFRTRKGEIDEHSRSIEEHLRRGDALPTAEVPLEITLLDGAFQALARQFDQTHGGFGGAPKFPPSMVLGFLLRHWQRVGSGKSLEMIETTLEAMARGGIYDHVGGGFHRYSVDERWLVPHFEKMLYDNALLARLYIEAFQATGKPAYARTARETLQFVSRELSDPAGGFYSALDADSEGYEGKYYVWTRDEIDRVLGADDARLFSDYFDVTATGNFEGANIVHPRLDLTAFARSAGKTVEEITAVLDEGRARLLAARQSRVRPGLDDKVLCAWNGLMLSAFAQAGFVLNDSTLLDRARANARFLLSEMKEGDRLRRVWKNGIARLNAYLEDYAFVIDGLVTLFEATGESQWLGAADELMKTQLNLFDDPESGLFYFTSSDHENLLLRQKEYTDNAIPSGNSLSCLNLLRLGELTGNADYRRRASAMLEAVAAVLGQYPTAMGYWLQALDFYLGPVDEIALTGPAPGREELLEVIRSRYIPRKVLAWSAAGEETTTDITLLRDRPAIQGRATAYVCRNFTCQQPVTSAQALEEQLRISRISGT